MQKILGLDIGSSSIKAVILAHDFKSFTVDSFIEEPVLHSAGMDEWAMQTQALKQLLEKNPLEYDAVYAALDSRHAVIRRVEFENVRKRDISAFLENELEGSTPFDLEDAQIDHQIISYVKGHATVLAVLAKKESIQRFIQLLSGRNLQVRKIDIDSTSYLNISSFLPTNAGHPQSCHVIIDIGHKKTTITFIAQNKVIFARVINIGGWYFTEKIKNEFKLKFSDAEKLKCSISHIDLEKKEYTTDKNDLIAAYLTQLVASLCNEVSSTIQSFLTQETLEITQIFVTGGSSKIKNLPEYFENVLAVPVAKLSLENLNIGSADPAVVHQSLAIALRCIPQKKAISTINLRKGHFVLANQYDKLIRQIKLLLVTASVVLACLFISYLFRYFLYSSQTSTIKSQFYKDTTIILSAEPISLRKISRMKNLDFQAYSNEALSLIRKNLEEKTYVLEGNTGSANPLTLRVLNQISEAVPKSPYFEVSDFKISNRSLFIQADTDNSDNIQKIVESLKSLSILTDVKSDSQESKVGSDGKMIHFSLSALIAKGER